jgi:hypothetical protein
MRPAPSLAVLASASVLAFGTLPAGARPAGALAPTPRAIDARYSPYDPDPTHPWNQLHQALFVRRTVDGGRRIHTTDPLLYRGGTFLLEGESHRRALAELDRFLAGPGDRPVTDPLKRLFLQHDLWAAFDYAAWYPDEWVFKSKYEPAAIALRARAAQAISKLALTERELAAVPDNYALAVKSKQYAADYDANRPERPFLPANLLDADGPWVRFHETSAKPMAQDHFDGAGGRSAHVIFLRLPGGREATERYLAEVRGEKPFLSGSRQPTVKQFPAGTMVAMVRRALTVDAVAKIRGTPVTELVQIRVYRRIPDNPEADRKGDFGEQDVYEFILDRSALFAGKHGLRAVERDDPAEPLFGRREGDEPFERDGRTRFLPPCEPDGPQLKTCIHCHAAPGVYSVLSMGRGLRKLEANVFHTYTPNVELKYTVFAKVERFDWGMLRGKLEGK